MIMDKSTNMEILRAPEPTVYVYTIRTYKKTESKRTKPQMTQEERERQLRNSYKIYNKNSHKEEWSTVRTAEYTQTNFSLLDIRVGRITHVRFHPESNKVYVCDVDIGIGRPVVVVAGLGKSVHVVAMIMRWVLLLCNIETTLIMGLKNEAKILCGVSPSHVEPLLPPEAAEPGDFVVVRGYPRRPVKFLNEKERIFQTIIHKCKTNNESIATYKDIPWEVQDKGFIHSQGIPHLLIR